MLVHPEVYAWLNRQNRTELEEKKARPLVARSEKINKGGPEKARQADLYDPDLDATGPDDVDYLNERKSNLNLYC